jgi:molybdopterin-guanine dinucleotide biosynthesis protein A
VSRAAGIVLAGGESARFGSDKLEAELEGRTLLDLAVAAVGAVVPMVIVVFEPGSRRRIESPPGVDVVTTRDAVTHGGPLSGLEAGLDASIEAGADRVVVVGGDMPTLEPSVLAALISLVGGSSGAAAAAAVVGGAVRPLPCALRAVEAAAATRELLRSPDRSLRAMLARLEVVELPEREWRRLDPEGSTFLDVDVPDDLFRARGSARPPGARF